ncbi:hypothetical protein CCACVL1_07873 [Corchorus capsularis]|uniref:Uncharacterized protein n=1 Tax=Corchorus capsularis TaxID=210143 RepID=A0A1R3J3G1_COCAP|nr:hypothetical protein CCACVL1_07873 [Corchorus capsularis]
MGGAKQRKGKECNGWWKRKKKLISVMMTMMVPQLQPIVFTKQSDSSSIL